MEGKLITKRLKEIRQSKKLTLDKGPHAKRFITDIDGLNLTAGEKKKFFSENVDQYFAKNEGMRR